MKKLFLAILLTGLSTAQAQIEKSPIFATSLRNYGGFALFGTGAKYGGIYSKLATANTWCLGYATGIDLADPTCMLQWNTSGVTITGTIAQTGNQTITGDLAVSGTLTTTGASAAATYNSGNGATEVYDQDQDLMTSDAVTFLTVTGNTGTFTQVAVNTGTFTQVVVNTGTFHDVIVTSNITAGGYIAHKRISVQEVVTNTPTVQGLEYFCTNCAGIGKPIWSIIGSWIYADGTAAP